MEIAIIGLLRLSPPTYDAQTKRQCRCARGSSSTRSGPGGFWLQHERGCSSDWLQFQCGGELVPCSTTGRRKSLDRALLSGATAKIDSPPGEAPDSVVGPRSSVTRLPYQSVDYQAHRPAHRGRVRRLLPSQSHRAPDVPAALESSKAQETRHRERSPGN